MVVVANCIGGGGGGDDDDDDDDDDGDDELKYEPYGDLHVQLGVLVYGDDDEDEGDTLLPKNATGDGDDDDDDDEFTEDEGGRGVSLVVAIRLLFVRLEALPTDIAPGLDG